MVVFKVFFFLDCEHFETKISFQGEPVQKYHRNYGWSKTASLSPRAHLPRSHSTLEMPIHKPFSKPVSRQPGHQPGEWSSELCSCFSMDRQMISQQCWSPDRNLVRVLSLQDIALHSCLHRKQISNISILLAPIHLSIVALYPLPPGPYLAICYCSYAGCLLLEMNNCCHHRLSPECVSVSWL